MTNLSSHSPIDGSVVWSGSAATPDQIQRVMQRSADAFVLWRATDTQTRIGTVRRFEQELRTHRDVVSDLISREVGKLPWDAAAEVNAAIAKIELSIQALQSRRSEQIIESATNAPARVIRFQPLGVTLVLGPFNFPLHLPGGQIIPALLAGNTVVFKPSDQATAVGQWMTEAWNRAGLPDGVFQMIVGGVDTAVAAIDSPVVKGVFLTGSRGAGRAIHKQLAGRPEVLLALELGGNNPVVICGDAEADKVAATLTFSAFISSGQRCTCARRAIFVESESTRDQIDAAVAATENLLVGMPGDQPVAHLGPLISAAAVDRIRDTYQQLVSLGCTPRLPLREDPRATTLLHPAIVDATHLNEVDQETLGQMEWFGPILVIQRVASFEEAIAAAAQTSYGLAASLLGGTQEMFHRFVQQVGAGVVNWNGPTTGAAGALPFGGLGESGNHRPAGYYAIDFCSDPVASLQQAKLPEGNPWSVVK